MSPGLCRGRKRTGSYRGGTVDITPIGRDGATDIATDGTAPALNRYAVLASLHAGEDNEPAAPDAGGAPVLEPAE